MITGCNFDSGAGQHSPAPGPVPSTRPDRQHGSERRIARALNSAPHAWWLARAIAALVHRPWWALALVVLCMAMERARRSCVTRRQDRRTAIYGRCICPSARRPHPGRMVERE